MRIKIRGGTAREDEPSLCLTCRHATVIRGRNLRDEIIDYGLLYRDDSRITFPVAYCSGYSDRRQPTLREMEDMAWVLSYRSAEESHRVRPCSQPSPEGALRA